MFERAAPRHPLLYPLPLGTASRLPDLWDLLETTVASLEDADGGGGECGVPIEEGAGAGGAGKCERGLEPMVPLDLLLQTLMTAAREGNDGGQH